MTPTQNQTASACLSFRHDFGLLDEGAKHREMHVALEWLRAWGKAGVLASSTAPSMADMQAMADPITSDPAKLDAYMAANPLPDGTSSSELPLWWTMRDQMAWALLLQSISTSDARVTTGLTPTDAFGMVDAFMAEREARK
jgi:hypothetical protein